MVARFAGISKLFSSTKPSVANAMQVDPFNNYFKTKPSVGSIYLLVSSVVAIRNTVASVGSVTKQMRFDFS